MRSALVGRVAPRATSAALTRPKHRARKRTAMPRGKADLPASRQAAIFGANWQAGSLLKGPSRLLCGPPALQLKRRPRSHTAADAAGGLYHRPARRCAPFGFARHASLFSLAKSPRPVISPRASGRRASDEKTTLRLRRGPNTGRGLRAAANPLCHTFFCWHLFDAANTGG